MRRRVFFRPQLEVLEPRTLLSTYYVAPTGNDGSAGTQTQPFATVNHGVSVLRAGDSLYLRAGTYAEALLNPSLASGTSWSAPVTVAAYPGENVTIQPAAAASATHIIKLLGNYSYIIFDGLVLDGVHIALGNNDGQGIYLGGDGSHSAQHVRFQDCEVKNCRQSGVILDSSQPLANYNEFINVHSHDTDPGALHHGFYCATSYNLFDGCEGDHNGGFGLQIYQGNAVAGSASHNVVRNGKFHDDVIGGLVVTATPRDRDSS